MTTMLEDIIKNKKKPVPSDELIELRGDTENDKPYWADNYTPDEWSLKRSFEKMCSEEDTYAGVIGLGDLSDYEI